MTFNQFPILVYVFFSLLLVPACGQNSGGGAVDANLAGGIGASNIHAPREDGWTTIKVVRSSNKLIGVAAGAQIKVNGKSMGTLSNGQSKEFKIPATKGISEFVITYHTLDGNSTDGTTQYFEANPDAEISVEIDLGAWDGEWIRSFTVVSPGSW